MDFQDGSYGYRPKRGAHDALDRFAVGLYRRLTDVIDLDLKSYFDTVRHDILLTKIAQRVNDPEIMKLCKLVLKSGGKVGVPQGSIIGPLLSNLYLNDIDKMLERAQTVTRNDRYETIRYVRFADDLMVMVSCSPRSRQQRWTEKVMLRLNQELGKLRLEINEEKTKIVRVGGGEALDYLGYTLRVGQTRSSKKRYIQKRPMRKKRTEFLRSIKKDLKRNRFRPVKEVIKLINPRIRGWVNYFNRGQSAKDLTFVSWRVESKIRRFATRQTPKKRTGGTSWSKWSREQIYGDWGLFCNYHVYRPAASSSQRPHKPWE